MCDDTGLTRACADDDTELTIFDPFPSYFNSYTGLSESLVFSIYEARSYFIITQLSKLYFFSFRTRYEQML